MGAILIEFSGQDNWFLITLDLKFSSLSPTIHIWTKQNINLSG